MKEIKLDAGDWMKMRDECVRAITGNLASIEVNRIVLKYLNNKLAKMDEKCKAKYIN